MIALGAFLFFVLLSRGFSFWFFFNLVLWVTYLYLLRKNYLIASTMTFSQTLTIGIVLMLFSFFSLSSSIPSEQRKDSNSSGSSNSSSEKPSKKMMAKSSMSSQKMEN
ncbi:MAG: hypothetical protein U9O20_02440 [Patescibacteria group bacterium]|nr:hypothetical protein [Patescibacteria group bacterium]